MTGFAVILAVFGILGGVVGAVPITYTETVTGTGTLGASAFTNALVTVTLIADTANVSSPSSGLWYSGAGIATVNVAGLGLATFTDPDIEAYRAGVSAGITNLTIGGWPILATLNAGFAAYDLQSSIGPLSGAAGKSGFFTPTTLGDFRLVDVSGNSTFTATTVPEPASVTLLSAGLLALTAFRLRTQRSNRS